MGQGLTQAQIGVMVGRDKSQISQIARGKYPGNNLAPALTALVEGKPAKIPEHRLGRDVPSTAWVHQGGIVIGSEGAAGMRKTLRNVSRARGHDDGGLVDVTIHGSDASGAPRRLRPWKHGGIRSRVLLGFIDSELRRAGVDPSRASAEQTTRALARVLADTRGDGVEGSPLPDGFVINSVSVRSLGITTRRRAM